MAKKATTSNELFINKIRTAKCVYDNVILGHGAWDYSFILLMGGVLKLTDTRQYYLERHGAAEFSAWLAEETLKRLYRFKYSKARDEIHGYVREFLADHQQGKLKRWIYQRIYHCDDYVTVTSNLLGDYQD